MANILNFDVSGDFNSDLTPSVDKSIFRSLLQVLVWEAAFSRIFFEILIGINIFGVLNNSILRNSYNGLLLPQVALASMIALIIIYVDRRFFCGSVVDWERSIERAMSGDLEKANVFLRKSLASIIPPPVEQGLLRSVELSLMRGEIDEAERFLSKLKTDGSSRYKSELYKYRGLLFSDNNKNSAIFDPELEAHPEPLMQIERAMFALFRENDSSLALKLSDTVTKLPLKIHPSNTSTHELSYLISILASLHNGKAEMALPKLNMLLDFLKFQIINVPNLRPYLSFSLLERAKYYAKRQKSKDEALSDIRLALAICNFPAHASIAREIRSKIS